MRAVSSGWEGGKRQMGLEQEAENDWVQEAEDEWGQELENWLGRISGRQEGKKGQKKGTT